MEQTSNIKPSAANVVDDHTGGILWKVMSTIYSIRSKWAWTASAYNLTMAALLNLNDRLRNNIGLRLCEKDSACFQKNEVKL